MDNKEKSISEMQNNIKEFTEKYNLEISQELRYIDLVSEVGELGKEILKSTDYGTKENIKTDNLESEIGDTLFSLICIANTNNIDLEKVLTDVLGKYTKRFEEKGTIGSEQDKE